MKVYIAGRITGDPRYREKFAEAEAALREVGHIPLNPAVLPEGMEAEDYMRICTAMLDSADAIGLLGDCDRMVLDAVRRLEQLMEVLQDG